MPLQGGGGGAIFSDTKGDAMNASHPTAQETMPPDDAFASAMLDAALDAVLLVDHCGAVRRCNRLAEQMFQMPEGSLLGSTFNALVPSVDLNQLAGNECFRTHARRGDDAGFDVQISAVRRHWSSQRWFVVVLRDMMVERQMKSELADYVSWLERDCIFVPARDETTCNPLEALRIAHAQADRAREAKSDYLAEVSHQIRTALMAVLGFTEMLHEPDIAPDDRDAAATAVRRNAKTLLDVTDELLDVARLEAGKLKIRPTRCVLRELMESMREQLSGKAADRGVQLHVTIMPNAPECLEVDTARFQQVLGGLIGAAIQSAAGGQVEVLLRTLAGRLCIDVQEIDCDVHSGTFYDLPIAARHRTLGSMIVCQRVARLLSGDLELLDGQDGGGMFRFSLPLPVVDLRLDEPEGAPGYSSGEAAMSAPKRLVAHVLLAEDGPDNQRVITHLLRRAGAQVTAVSNGLQACEEMQTRGHSFDLLLMDIEMPVLDGLEATRRLRKLGCQLPIVAITAHSVEEMGPACIKAGCDECLSKPIDREALTQTLSRHLPALCLR